MGQYCTHTVRRTCTLYSMGWEEFFSAAHGGRPYYVNRETGVTQWAQPSDHRMEEERVDAAVFNLDVDGVRHVMNPLRRMQSQSASWTAARGLLLRVVGNIVGQPDVEKYRSVNCAAGSKFFTHVRAIPGGADLMRALGFMETTKVMNGDIHTTTLTLPRDAPLEPCRLAHCHIERSTKLTTTTGGDGGQDGGQDGGGSGGTTSGGGARGGGGHWNNHTCSECACVIHSGQERVWTNRWDAPRGEFRYRCNQCTAPEYNLCEKCWDQLRAAREAAGQLSSVGVVWHDPSHTFEHIHPIESRHNTALHGDGPWGNFSGSVSARSRERLRDRTGL